MAIRIEELIERLREFPGDWMIYATRQGSSLEIWEPGGSKYAYVFTDERPAKHYQSRRGRQSERSIGGSQ
jgi:hypothetical protein